LVNIRLVSIFGSAHNCAKYRAQLYYTLTKFYNNNKFWKDLPCSSNWYPER